MLKSNRKKLIIAIAIMFTSCAPDSKLPFQKGWWMWTPGDHVENSIQLSLTDGWQPEQPIPFSHKLHAGQLKMDCQDCHYSTRKSKSGGVPPLETCMGCHKFVNTNAEPIKILTEKYNKNEPIEWIKVHDLPDYVRFNHQAHVLAKDENGELKHECQTCHGPYETYEVAPQWAPLQMGWCIGCHSKQPSKVTSHETAMTNSLLSCSTCHY